MRKGHGNCRLSQRNRRRNNKNTPVQQDLYEMIDGNFTYQPEAYCKTKKAYLTKNMAIRHHCIEKNCPSYVLFEDYKEKKND